MLSLHDELGAVAVHLLFGVFQEVVAHVRSSGFEPAFGCRDAQDDRLLAHEVDHAGEERHDPLAARVHDACLLEHGQLLRRVRQRTLGGLICGTQHIRQARCVVRRVDGFCRRPHDAEHRPFHRVADGLITRVSGATQGRCERRAVSVLAVCESACEAFHELGEDNAAVAARA